MTFEIDLGGAAWGLDDQTFVPIMLKFEYISSDTSGNGSIYVGFKGDLWPQVDAELATLERLTHDSRLAPRLMPIPETPQFYISLLDLGGCDASSVAKLQGLIPTYITVMSFELSNQDVAFSGTMVASPNAVSRYLFLLLSQS